LRKKHQEQKQRPESGSDFKYTEFGIGKNRSCSQPHSPKPYPQFWASLRKGHPFKNSKN
jgi:hypothetical protein